MAIKLAFRNLIKKPMRSMSIILAIAIAVAMFFSMLSFKSAVYDFIYAQEISESGNTDIFVTYDSKSDRILNIEPLKSVQGVKEIYPTLSLFATHNNEYVRVRGLEKEQIDKLNSINVYKGDISQVKNNTNRIIISRTASEDLNLNVGDGVYLQLGSKNVFFVIGVVAENDGYFVTESPYTFIGISEGGISRLISTGAVFYNEIYIKLNENTSVEKAIADISAIPEYADKKVAVAVEEGKISQLAESLSAPIAIAGGAVAFLGITFIYVLFVLSEKEKRAYASKLSIIGAKKGQVFNVFAVENTILAFIGAIIGSALACGVFYGLVKLVLSKGVTFNISALYLFLAAVIGALVAFLSSLIPLNRAFKSSVKENLMQIEKKSVFDYVLPCVICCLVIITVSLEFCVPALIGYISVVNILLVLLAVGLSVPYVLRGVSALTKKIEIAPLKIASNNLLKEKRNGKTVSLMTVGMTVSMILFMAWSVSTSVFGGYKSEMADLIFLTNIPSTIDLGEVAAVEGVEKASAAIWRNGELRFGAKNKAVSIIGTKDATDIFNFKYVTDKEEITSILKKPNYETADDNKLILDKSFAELYELKVGDSLNLSIGNKNATFTIGGFVSQVIFSGQYIIVSENVLKGAFDLDIDCVIVKTNQKIEKTVGLLKTKFAEKNYFCLTALDAYKWSDQSTEAVFDLVGTLAGVITALIFIALLASIVVSRTASSRQRRALLSSGMSKNSLLCSELLEHTLLALIAYIVAFAVSPLLTFSLINALRLFDLYFEFMYNATVVSLVGLAMMLAYSLTPLIMNFKRGYKLKVRE